MNNLEKEQYKQYINQQRKKHTKKIIKSQTGSGKTENIVKLLKRMALGNCIIAVPTNELKKEEYKRLVNKGIENIKMTPELERLRNNKIDEMQQYYIEIGAWSKRKEYLQNQVDILEQKEKTEIGLSEDERQDLYNIKYYLNENEEINHYWGHIVTTHERAMNLHWYLVWTHTLIIDEDILPKAGIKTPTYRLRYIENTFDVVSTVVNNSVKEKLEEIENAPTDEIVPVSQYNISYFDKETKKEIEELLSETDKYVYNIYDLLQCSAIYKYKDPKQNEIKVQCLIVRKPPNMRTIILSATIDEEIYRNFFSGDKLEFVELPKAKYKGKIIQDCTITYSRKSLITDKKNETSEILDKIREKHKGLPLITFKKFCQKGEYHFGAIEGLDLLKGRDIVVVGLPYHNELLYRFYMYAIYGIVYNPTKLSRFRRIENSNYSFKLNTQDNKEYQKIQTYLIGSELEQAVGRARLLRYDCTVYLYSGFPVEQTNLVYNTLNLESIRKIEKLEED